MASSVKATASAVQFVDVQLQTVANAVERFAGLVSASTANADGGFGQKLGDPISRRLTKTVAQLRAQNGDAIIGAVKSQMLQHPKATVGIAAAVGAIVAQAALVMLKGERATPTKGPIRALPSKNSSDKKNKSKKPVNDD